MPRPRGNTNRGAYEQLCADHPAGYSCHTFAGPSAGLALQRQLRLLPQRRHRSGAAGADYPAGGGEDLTARLADQMSVGRARAP